MVFFIVSVMDSWVLCFSGCVSAGGLFPCHVPDLQESLCLSCCIFFFLRSLFWSHLRLVVLSVSVRLGQSQVSIFGILGFFWGLCSKSHLKYAKHFFWSGLGSAGVTLLVSGVTEVSILTSWTSVFADLVEGVLELSVMVRFGVCKEFLFWIFVNSVRVFCAG